MLILNTVFLGLMISLGDYSVSVIINVQLKPTKYISPLISISVFVKNEYDTGFRKTYTSTIKLRK